MKMDIKMLMGLEMLSIIKDFVILDIQKNLLKIISLKLSLNMNSMIFKKLKIDIY